AAHLGEAELVEGMPEDRVPADRSDPEAQVTVCYLLGDGHDRARRLREVGLEGHADAAPERRLGEGDLRSAPADVVSEGERGRALPKEADEPDLLPEAGGGE